MLTSARQKNLVVGAVLAALASFLVLTLYAKEPKMKPEDLIANHLSSIADTEALSSIETRILEGNGTLTQVQGVSSGGYVDLGGPATWASAGPNCRLAFQFGHPSYTGDEVVYDGEHLETSRPRPGADRSMLGDFLYTYKTVIKEGLLGGALSTNWALRNIDTLRPKLKYEGIKEVGEQDYLALRYKPRRGGRGVKILLFFDPATFRHVATQYEVKVPGQQGDNPEQSIQTSRYAYFTLTESFSGFQNVDGLVLPTKWTLRLSRQEPGFGLVWDWTFQASGVAHNREIPADFFAKPTT